MIDFNQTKQYTLSIRLSTDGFCFAVHDPQADSSYAYLPFAIDPLKSLVANLKSALKEVDMLRHTYAKVKVLVAEASYTFVPKEYYDHSCARDFYLQNFPQSASNIEVLHNYVGDDQAVVLFGLDHLLYQCIIDRFPKAEVFVPVTPLANLGLEKSVVGTKRYCLVHLCKQYADMLCFADGEILFANTFYGRDVADIQYFLLNTWQTLGLSQKDDTLHVVGQSRNVKVLVRELGLFIKTIHTIHPAEEFHSTELARIGEMPFDLQALIACE
ncbi:MAG: DUF3822 family protein [Bacteroidaceae bacterium]|nr:DUF3822 family protein [Bacteroidaceae bacterium]